MRSLLGGSGVALGCSDIIFDFIGINPSVIGGIIILACGAVLMLTDNSSSVLAGRE